MRAVVDQAADLRQAETDRWAAWLREFLLSGERSGDYMDAMGVVRWNVRRHNPAFDWLGR